MKKLLLAWVLVLGVRTAHAAPITYIQSKSTGTQLNATIFVDTGTIRSFTCSTCAVLRALQDSSLSSGTSGYAFTSRGSTLGPQWLPSGAVGGSSGQIQYNNGGSLGGIPGSVSTSSVTISTPTAIMGVITNSAAGAGYVGQYIESLITNVSVPAATTWGDITSIALTPGDWDVSGILAINPNGATFSDLIYIGISATSGNDSTGLTPGQNEAAITPGTIIGTTLAVPVVHVLIASNATYYLKFNSNFSVATPKAFAAKLSARRMR